MTLADFISDDEADELADRLERLEGLGCPSPEQAQRTETIKQVLTTKEHPSKGQNFACPPSSGKPAPPQVVKKW